MKYIKKFESFNISLSDIRKNFDELIIYARWLGKKLKYKVHIDNYKFVKDDFYKTYKLKLYLSVEKNDQIGSNIIIVVDSYDNVFLYYGDGEPLDAELIGSPGSDKSWLRALYRTLKENENENKL